MSSSASPSPAAGRIALLLMVLCGFCAASIFARLRGIIHDPQHRPIAGAHVSVLCGSSHWSSSKVTNSEGEFDFPLVPIGACQVTVQAQGFNADQQSVVLDSSSAPILHFILHLRGSHQEVTVSGSAPAVNLHSSTTQSLISRSQIDHAPGAGRANSLAMITDFVPGAYMVHDQLHVRGGHQVSWEIDGVPVPNTSIASNVGPQFDPADIAELEVQRGGYSAAFGDRTYGVFNVVPRSGFERDREGQLVTSYGSFDQTDDDFSLGSHTDRFAWYGSVNGNRTDLGLETPTPAVLHDQASGLGGFGSLIFNATPHDQLRWVGSLRHDHYQVPNTPEQQRAGAGDLDIESDALLNFSWLHTWNNGAVLQVSPFYHFNAADYRGGAGDQPVSPTEDRSSKYIGGQVSVSMVKGAHNARAGFYTFAQRDNELFGLTAHDGSGLSLQQSEHLWGNLEAAFVEDQYRVTPWFTLNLGLRGTRFSGGVNETALSPRLGAALVLPRLHWVLRGYYGESYQAPPLDTLGGPLLNLAVQQGFGFLALHGERDQMEEIGLTAPWRGWVLDTDVFRTTARNFFDHDVIGNSNIFLPLTIDRARIRGWEATLRSPRLERRMQLHAAFSHQFVQGFGGVSGGLTDFSPPENSYYFLDHDQRNTLSVGWFTQLAGHAWADVNLNYGSGFLLGDGPQHLPAHATADVALGIPAGERWQIGLQVLNLTNQQYLLDTSNSFGGTHYANPREFIVQMKYRFNY